MIFFKQVKDLVEKLGKGTRPKASCHDYVFHHQIQFNKSKQIFFLLKKFRIFWEGVGSKELQNFNGVAFWPNN